MENRKEQILDEAADLLQSRSYTSFSYQDLSERLGIRKASIHHHFATKEALGIALIERFSAENRAKFKAISQEFDDPWERFNAYVDSFKVIEKDGTKICPVGVIQAEFNVVPETVRSLLNELNQFFIDWVAGVLKEGRERGVMDFPGTPDGQAELVISAFQGALQQSRASSQHKFRVVAQQIRSSMIPRNN